MARVGVPSGLNIVYWALTEVRTHWKSLKVLLLPQAKPSSGPAGTLPFCRVSGVGRVHSSSCSTYLETSPLDSSDSSKSTLIERLTF